MNAKNNCPCCYKPMLRHLTSQYSYWFCGRCRLEMPDIARKKATLKNTVLDSASTDVLQSSQKITESIATH